MLVPAVPVAFLGLRVFKLGRLSVEVVGQLLQLHAAIWVGLKVACALPRGQSNRNG